MCHPLLEPPFLFLKSIDITGFKSFARSVRLELPPGISALVGPNGSGKSNIVDALRWAIGEQSMRELRGQRSEDVIYAGPRRTVGLAEVTLTLDTGERAGVPAEIAVARRLYRSGESEYLVQGRRSRLRDVQDTLRGLDIAGADTMVVTQGLADALLTATPQERRLALEQTAGLSGYRVRREEARQKLQSTAQNVQTMELILAELEPRLRILRRQARAVRDRDEAQARLAQALESWYADRWVRVRAHVSQLSQQCAAEDAMRVRLVEELRALEEAAESALSVERDWRRRVDLAQAAVHSTQRELDAARFSSRSAEQELAALERSAREAQRRRSEIDLHLEEARSRERASEQALASSRAEQASVDERFKGVLADIAGAASELRSLEDAARAAASASAAAEARLADASAQKRQLQDALRAGQDHRQLLAGRLQSLIQELEETGREREELTRTLAICTSAACQAAELAAHAGTTAEKARREWNRRVDVDRWLRSRHAGLVRQRDSAARTVEALRPQLEETLISSLQAPCGWETAIAAAVGEWPRGAARPNADDLSSLLSWRARLDGLALPGRWADMLVPANVDDVTPLHTALLVEGRGAGDRAWTLLAPMAGHLIGTPQVRVITRAGEVIASLAQKVEAEGEMGARYLIAAGELGRLNARIAVLRAWVERSALAVSTSRDVDQTAQEEAAAAERERRAALDRQTEGERDLATCERTIDRLGDERGRLQTEVSALDVEVTELERAQLERGREEAACCEQLETAKRELDRAREALQAQREVASAREAEKTELERLSAILAARARSEEQALGVHAGQVRRLEQEGESIDVALSAQRAERERWSDLAVDEQARLEGLGSILAEQQAELTRVRSEEPEPVVDRDRLESVRRTLSGQVAEHERVRALLSQAEEERARLQVEIVQELQRSPDLLGEPELPVPGDDEIRRLRSRANQYPDADASAIQECEEIEARYTRLRDNVEDLQDAARELDAIIELAEAEMKSRFQETFTALTDEFSRVFRVMLRGGDATLELADDGGVLVRAQLPGKRVRSSSSFSGGEKALVASSLLFAMIALRPTPFVVLDEVDAALDESNVDRFVAALRDISRRTQVILVTHNRATMEAADVLYGVTMDDEGVSKLLSLRLDAYEAAG